MSNTDQMQAMQKRIDGYIQSFEILNFNNGKVLEDAHSKFNKDYDFKIQKFTELLDKNLQQIRDEKKHDHCKVEASFAETSEQVSCIHHEFHKLQEKRAEEKDAIYSTTD